MHPRARALPAFDLEQWMRDQEHRARLSIGGSGVRQGDLVPFLPRSQAAWERAWRTRPDDAREAVADGLARAYRLPPEEFLLTNGASEADFVATFALAGAGGHVVVESPTYFALVAPARALGCRVTRVERDPRRGFILDAAAIEAAIEKDTRLVVLARPHNPSGARPSDATMRRIARAADEVGAYVLVDEVFAEATPEGDRPARRLHDRILSVNSLTKCLGYGPLQLGWLAAPPHIVELAQRAKWIVRPVAPVLPLVIARRVIERRVRLLRATRALRARNRPLVEQFVHDSGLEWAPPEHGTTCVVKLPRRHREDVGFARRLLARRGVLVAPGSFLELPGWIRLSLVADTGRLGAGLKELARFLAAARATP